MSYFVYFLITKRRDSLTDKIELLERQLREVLDSSKVSVDQSLKDAASDTSKSLQELQHSVGQIKGHQGQIDKLVTKFDEVHQVLFSTKKQGKFGELVLEDIVRDTLPQEQYLLQKAISNGSIPDVLIKYPEPQLPVCVDSKFPLRSYRKILDAGSEHEIQQGRKEFATAMKNHITAVATKYIVVGETSDFALLFLPSEAIFLDLQMEHTDLVQAAIQKRVYCVSPNTTMALLQSIRSIHKDMEVVSEVKAILKNVVKLETAVRQVHDKSKTALNQFEKSHSALKEVATKAAAAQQNIEQLRELDSDTNDGNPRPITIDEVKKSHG